MPLMKRATPVTTSPVGETATLPLPQALPQATVATVSSLAQVVVTPPVEAAKARAAKVSKDVPLNKEDYWNRKEERDIETGKRIRRSGVWQAALGSVGLLQLNAGNTFESYMALVAKAAEEGLKFVNAD